MIEKLKGVSFPDPLAPDEEKNKKAYGLSFLKCVEQEWFSNTSAGENSCRFLSRRDDYHRLRLYARGEQPTDHYKKMTMGDTEESKSYTNYDFRPIQVIPKFVNLIVNQMSERLFDVRAEATDKYSTDLRDQYKKNLENLMASKDMLRDAKSMLNVNMTEEGLDSIPESQEEIDLYMKLKYKPGIEIATEEAIKYTLDLNDFEETQGRVMHDITTLGVAGVKHHTDSDKGIMVEYCDVADMVYAFPTSRNFENVYYYGEYEKITIGELKRISDLNLTDEEWRSLAAASSEWNTKNGLSNTQTYREDDLDGFMVDILNVNFKAQNTRVHKKKYNQKSGGYKLTKKESTFDKKDPNYKGYDVVKKTYDVWYKGSLVMGTQHLFNYGLCENMVRPKGHLNKTLPNYILYAPEIYQGRSMSLVNRMIPYVDQMQLIHIKLQQLIAKARPNGIRIDVDGLSEVTMGDGNVLTPLEQMKIYDQTGNVLVSSVNAEGNYNYGKDPITELKNGIVDGVDRLIVAYNHYLNLLRDSIGIAQGADASLPHPDTLVAVQKQAALNSNTATRHILDSVLNITEKTGTALALRIKDIFKYSNLKEAYIQAIGKINVDILKSIENYALHDFGIHIELKPDTEEKQYLEANIANALSKDLITLDDAIDIRNINNIKLANEVLKIRRVKREKEKREHEERMVKVNAEANSQAAEKAAQAKMMEMQSANQNKLSEINAERDSKLAEIDAEEKAKSRLMEQEFMYNMRLKGIEVEGKKEIERRKDDEKMKRQNKNNTQASQMIDQRTKDKAPINFESANDHLGMELSSFEPK